MVIFLLNQKVFSQTDPLRQKLDSIFQYVDKAQIPTGYLKEYGSEFMPVQWFNGILTDSNTVNSLDVFRTAYFDMVTAKLPAQIVNPQARLFLQFTTLLPLQQVNSQIDSVANNNVSPIAILYTKYASLKETALADNLFTVSNQQIYDVPNRTTSPYDVNKLFVAAPIQNEFTNTVSLRLDNAFFYKNMNVIITDAFVDFKDGQGYRSLGSSPTTKTYTDSSGRKPIVLKVITSDGSTLYCNSSVLVTVTNNTANRYIDDDPLQANIEVPVLPTDGISGGDFMQIRYAKNNPTRLQPQRHVRKPLIYVEGYDVNNKNDIYSLIRNNPANPKKGEWIDLDIIYGYDFMRYLDDTAGFDLIYVNYNTLRSFEDNTKMLQQVIQWVNADKIMGTGGTATQNVVLGVSAGGVLSRYTLARMTKFVGVNSTDTRLLITMDSPHQGANVPLALQHFLYDLGEQTILGTKIKAKEDDLQKFYDLNAAPATAQLLKARVIDNNGTVVFNTFLNGDESPYQKMVRYDAINNPTNIVPPYKFVAVAQGSQCGVPVTTPSVSFASQDGEFAIVRAWIPEFTYITSKWWLTTNLYALPNSGIADIEYFKFERRIKLWGIGFGWKIITDTTRQNPPGYVGWDAAPGSTQSIADRADGGLTAGLSKRSVGKFGKYFARLRAGASMTINQDAFSFVNPTSALDAPLGTSPYSSFNFNINGNANTSVLRYQTQAKESGSTLFNRNHTDYSPRNAKWIFEEMQDLPHDINCDDYCIDDIKITPDAGVCNNSNTYEIANLPTGATVVWAVTPVGIVSTSALNANPITLARINEGTITLTANVTLPCSNIVGNSTTNVVYSKTLNVANVGFTGTYIANVDPGPTNLVANTTRFIPVQRGQNVSVFFNIASTQNLTNLRWNTDANATSYGYGNTYSFSLQASQYGYNSINRTVQLFADSPCGPVSYSFGFNIMSMGWRMVVTASPNPTTTGEININIAKVYDNTTPPANFPAEIKAVNPYTKITLTAINNNSPAKTLLAKEDVNTNYKINTNGLSPGAYSLTVERNNIITTTNIVIL